MNRVTQIAVGCLFLIATISYLTGNAIVLSFMNQRETHLPVYIGFFLEYINSFSVIAIAILLFPVLYQKSKSIGLVYVISRVIESILLFISTIFPLLMTQNSEIETLNPILIYGYKQTFQIGMLSLSLGSLFLCYWLFMHTYIYRWLIIIGLMGYVLLFISSILSFSTFATNFIEYLYIPGAFFEIAFPIYLIVKGIKLKENDSILT